MKISNTSPVNQAILEAFTASKSLKDPSWRFLRTHSVILFVYCTGFFCFFDVLLMVFKWMLGNSFGDSLFFLCKFIGCWSDSLRLGAHLFSKIKLGNFCQLALTYLPTPLDTSTLDYLKTEWIEVNSFETIGSDVALFSGSAFVCCCSYTSIYACR